MAPDKFRGMAGWAINRCGGLGGYITADISNTIDYLINPTTDLTQRPRKRLSSHTSPFPKYMLISSRLTKQWPAPFSTPSQLKMTCQRDPGTGKFPE